MASGFLNPTYWFGTVCPWLVNNGSYDLTRKIIGCSVINPYNVDSTSNVFGFINPAIVIECYTYHKTFSYWSDFHQLSYLGGAQFV